VLVVSSVQLVLVFLRYCHDGIFITVIVISKLRFSSFSSTYRIQTVSILLNAALQTSWMRPVAIDGVVELVGL